MFSTSTSHGFRHPSANTYRDVGASTALDGASPHKLVSLLYSALASELACARGAIGRRDIAEKARAIAHAVRILEEGLLAPLNLQGGGALAINLHDLYAYMIQRITVANARNDDGALAECSRLLESLRDGWDGIAAQADRAQAPIEKAAA